MSGLQATLINIHLKCCGGSDNIARRTEASRLLKEYIDTNLAAWYLMDRKTFCRKLKEMGIILPKGLIMPATLKIIYEKLGYPPAYRPGENDEDTRNNP